MGRLVSTHSTFIEGLLKVLKKLSKDDRIKTITPSVITITRCHSSKLIIKITRNIKGGYKLVARKGSSAQELFILTKYNIDELEEAINKLI